MHDNPGRLRIRRDGKVTRVGVAGDAIDLAGSMPGSNCALEREYRSGHLQSFSAVGC
jgi:hypothetical protein